MPLLLALMSITLSAVVGTVSAAPPSGSSPAKTISAELDWATYLGTADYEAGEAIAVGPDGTLYVTGFVLAFVPFQIDTFVARVTPDGTTLLNSLLIEGSDIEGGFGIAVDAEGIVTIVGQTSSPDFPVTADAMQPALAGGADGFVMQLSPELDILYATYYGGAGEEAITDVALDGAAVVVCGYTGSADLPVTAGAFQTNPGGGAFDAFVARMTPWKGPDPADQLSYASYLGGSGSDTDPDVQDNRLLRQAVAVRPNGQIVVTGMTDSEDFPVTAGAVQTENHGALDLYVAVLDPRAAGWGAERQLVYSTLLGGSGLELAEDVTVRDNAQISLAAVSRSEDFPVTDNACQTVLLGIQDAVVVQLLAVPNNPQLTYSSYLGGSGRDAANGIYQLRSGDLVVGGVAGSDDFPVTDDSVLQGTYDLFLVRLDTSRKPERQFVMGTLFGGTGDEILLAGPVDDGFGNIYITGDTDSTDLPGVAGSLQETFAGGWLDAIIAAFDVGGVGYGQQPR
jgi:hypothetical protein